MGGTGGSMNFSNGTLTIGNWTIDNTGISNSNGSYLYPSRLSLNDGGEIITAVGGSVRAKNITATSQFTCGDPGSAGKTGRLTFTDGSYISITGGIITFVHGG